jgi:nitroreductase
MFQSPEGAAALLSATGEFAINGQRMSAAAAAVVRRSVRKYSDTPVTDAELRTLLELAGRAPSAFNLQPWRFIVVRDAALKDQLKSAAFNQQQVAAAPVVIVLYADMEDAMANLEAILNPGLTSEQKQATIQRLQTSFGAMSIEERAIWANAQSNIALGYLLLISQSEGFATSPMLGFQPDKVKALLNIPAHATITALVALGHAADDGYASHRLDLDRIADFR